MATTTTTTTTVTQTCKLLFSITNEPAMPPVNTTEVNFPISGLTSFVRTWAGGNGELTLSAFALPSPPAQLQSSCLSSTCTTCPTPNWTSCSVTNSSSAIPTGSFNCTSHHNTGLATGPTVGLAYGCIFAGALLALALGVFYSKQRGTMTKRSNLRRRPNSTRSHTGAGVISLAPSPRNSFPNVLEKLPAPITHIQFEQEASQWNININNYLHNYTELTADLGRSQEQTILSSEQLSVLAGHKLPWHRLLRDRKSRHNALRMLIARIISNRVDPKTVVETSLLPQNVLRMYQNIIAEEKQNPNVPLMRNIWRTITMNLISTTYNSPNVASSAISPEAPSIQKTTKTIHDAISSLLRPLSEARAVDETHALADVVLKGTLLGFHMFEQTNPTWFFWENEELSDHSLGGPMVVFPGIKQRRMQAGFKEPRQESVIISPICA